MFCPNCGTENDSAAKPCKKCGFKLSGISASKFKGTMLLNAEPASRGSEPAPGAPAVPGSAPPPAAAAPLPSPVPPLTTLPGAPRSVLQPPRAASGKRRVGATMLGVAPQAGGLTPGPSPQPQPSTPPAADPTRPGQTPAALDHADAAPAAPDPLAGTLQVPAAPEPEPAPDAGAAQGEPNAAEPGGTRPMPQVAELPAVAEARNAETVLEPLRASTLSSEAPREPEASPESARPVPRGIKPLEVVAIVATCGLYGVYMLLSQRKASQR